MVILVIGAGSIGRRHAANIEALGRPVELLPWRGFDRAAVERREDIAGLVIATATQVREELVALAAAKGWPLYIEKPLAFRAGDAARIYELAAPVAERSVVGLMMRYHPVMRALGDADLGGAFGFHFEIGHDVRQWRANWRFADSYAARPEGGGVLLDLCHEIDMAAALFPGLQPAGVTSLGHAEFPGVDFASRLSLVQPGGAIGEVAMDYIAPESFRHLSISTGAGRIGADLLGPELALPGRAPQRFDFERNDMFLGIMSDFLALAEGREPSGNPMMPRLDRVRESVTLVAAAWEARRFAGTVEMDMG